MSKDRKMECWYCKVSVPLTQATYDSRFNYFTCIEHSEIPPALHEEYKRNNPVARYTQSSKENKK
jgi:hypothetical protein